MEGSWFGTPSWGCRFSPPPSAAPADRDHVGCWRQGRGAECGLRGARGEGHGNRREPRQARQAARNREGNGYPGRDAIRIERGAPRWRHADAVVAFEKLEIERFRNGSMLERLSAQALEK